MSNKQRKIRKEWLSNLYSICTVITLFFIMAQVFFARRTMIQSGEWEKAKVTIDNIERFKENLKKTALYGKPEALNFSEGRLWPDFSTDKGVLMSDTLKYIYGSFFDDDPFNLSEDFTNSLTMMDAFAYPIIMGYASEIGSFQSVMEEFFSYGNYILIRLYDTGGRTKGIYVRLLYRLWRVRQEQMIINLADLKDNHLLAENINHLLYFEGTEFTPATLKQYEKKLDKEVKKIQKEIEVFRKSNLQ